MPTPTYSTIATTTLSTNDTVITFTNIPSTYTDLVLVVKGLLTTAGDDSLNIRVGNNSLDTGNNYYGANLSANTTTVTNNWAQGSSFNIGVFAGSGTQSSTIVHFFSYAGSTLKPLFSRGGTTGFIRYGGGLWNSTSAINQIQVADYGLTMAAGTTASLYGILKA